VTHFYRFDDVQIDVRNFRISKAGKVLQVEPKALNLLVYLVENCGRLVEKRELLDAIWNDAFVTENVLTRAIAQVRKALADDPKNARYIETVPTLGYRFIAQVQVEENNPAPSARPAPSESVGPPELAGTRPSARPGTLPAPQRNDRRLPSFALPILGVVACGLLVALAFSWRPRLQYYRPG